MFSRSAIRLHRCLPRTSLVATRPLSPCASSALVHRKLSACASVRTHAPANAASGDIFAVVHAQIPDFDQIQIEPDPDHRDSIHNHDSRLLAASLSLADMLPPAPVLDLIQKNGRLSIPSSDVYTVVQMVQSAWPDLDSTWGEKGLVERISKVCSIKDLTTIGTILFDHSVAGKPLGCKVLEICKNEGNMDAEFKYAHAISQGFPGQKRDLERSIALLESLVAKRHPLSTFVYALRLIKQATHQLPSPSTAAAASTPPAADIPKLTKGLRTLHACARELAFPQAQMQMGHLYLYGGLGVPRDAALAYPFLEGAARAGIPEAMFLCGVCWEKGDGTPGGVDFRKAFEWWTLAANKGLAIAQHNVASFFFGSHVSTSLSTPFPIEKNIPLALEYFEMAATQGLPLSLVNLAKLYKEGYRPLRGEPKFWAVAVDLNKARDYAERVTHLEGNWGDLGKSLLEDIDEERGVKN